MNDQKQKTKWYFKTYWVVIAFLCVGPLALPLVWLNPRLNKTKKIVISIIILILTYIMGRIFVDSITSISKYYSEMSEVLPG